LPLLYFWGLRWFLGRRSVCDDYLLRRGVFPTDDDGSGCRCRFLTLFAAFLVTLPVIGYASWRGYQETIIGDVTLHPPYRGKRANWHTKSAAWQ
jgi:hypothetical protein